MDMSKRHQERSLIPAMALGMAAALVSVVPARADGPAPDGGRLTVVEENDYFFHDTDHWFTQGGKISYLTSEVGDGDFTAPAFAWLDRTLFASDGTPSRHMDWSIGQSLFTPTDVQAGNPDRRDRPYAAFAYLDGGFVQSTTPAAGRGVSRLDDLEIELGIVGPQALGQEAQNDFHEYVLNQSVANGWSYQLRDEPALDLIYQRHWRLDLLNSAEDGKGFGVDIVPDAGGSAGNVYTYANAGATLRVGYRLNADYGPPRILPAPSGGDYFDDSVTDVGGYLFTGVEGRAVGRNIFLQGNTFTASRHVTALPAVGDFVFGGTLYWGRFLRATVTLDDRSKEFVGQNGPDRFTSLSLSANFDW